MILAVIQARMSSSRLPGKVLKSLSGKPMLAQQIHRVEASAEVDRIVVATSDQPEDDAIEWLCNSLSVACYRGSLNDVLERYYRCAEHYQADHVVRLTGDCPLIDAAVIDQVIRLHLTEQCDYTSNINPPTYPDGMDIEVMSFVTLQKAWQNARLMSEREHVTLYIRNHPELFSMANLRSEVNLSSLRWTVDEQQDLDFVAQIYAALYTHNPLFSCRDIEQFLRDNPQLLDMNAEFDRNEGLAKSLLNDSVMDNPKSQ